MRLNEFVEKTYLEFLKEQENKELAKIHEDYIQLAERMSAMAEWINFEAELEQQGLTEADINVEELQTQMSGLKSIFDSFASISSHATKPRYDYDGPIPDMTKKRSTGDNIRLFLGTIIDWIKNIITRIVEWFKKVFSSMFGFSYNAPDKKTDISFNSLMQKAKDADSLNKSFNSFGNTGYIDLSSSKVRNVLGVEDDKVKNLIFDKINHESANLQEKNNSNEEVQTKPVPVAYLDPSKDLFALREALNHFFRLFDDSVGSNGEKLFETDDLELLFKSFFAVQQALEDGNTDAYSDFGGKLTKLQLVAPDRLRDNLVRTKINTDKLSNAYQETQRIITNILQVIAQKNYQGSVLAPSTYKLISSASFKQMAEIIKVLDSRIKSSKNLEKNLGKMQDKYTKLTRELEKLRGQYLTLGSGYYAPSILQKEIGDLFVAAKYVTQTIMLRFATLGLYVKVLRETKDAIYNLNLINK